MRTITPEELKSTLKSHAKWLRGEEGGSRANLTDANLRGANLMGANLMGAYLTDANLRGANLTGAYLRGAELMDAYLTDANLTGANLTNAEGNTPIAMFAVPSLHRKMLAAIEQEGCKLDMATWHQCKTTHCRAGWAVQLCGPAGKALEWAIGPAAAGALIHLASCPALEGKVPNFYATNEEAMEDIRRLAALEELEGAK